MLCPHDGTELRRERYEGDVDIDTCATCGGVWLDPGELEAVMSHVGTDHGRGVARTEDTYGAAIEAAKQAGRAPLPCPVCGDTMERKEYGMASQVLVDTCTHGHGRWLDKGEIGQLEIYWERLRAEDAAEAAREEGGFWGALTRFFRNL